jgi:hypothetical protein
VRRFAALAGIVATSLAGLVAPAAEAERSLGTQIHLFGTVVATWQGDPARGCAQAGVCSVSGSATYKPGLTAHVGLGTGGASFGGSGAFTPAVVRVRDAAAGEAAACADALQPIFSPISIESSGGTIDAAFDSLELSSGRCAGPRTLDLEHALPRASIATARLRSRARVLDLSSRTRFAAGPFSGSVLSTVRIAFARLRPTEGFSSSDFSIGGIREGHARYAGVELDYRITGVSGALTTDFRGAPGAACTALGACGASGNSAYTLAGVSGDMIVFGTRRLAKGRRPPSYREALRALRRGDLPIDAFANLSRARATVAERFDSSSGTCSDSLFTAAPGIDLRPGGDALELRLQSQGALGTDSLRTRCPGPAEQDAIGRGSIASGKIMLPTLGGKRIRVVTTSGRSFVGGGYAGSRHGQLELSMELVRATAVSGTG